MSSRKYNSKKKILSGIISVHPHGFGFVNPALSQLNNSEITEIFIPAQDVNLAIDGDEVLVDHINNKKDKGWEGKVKKIVKRGRKSLVCQFLKYNRFNKPLFECQLLDDRIVLIDNKKLGKIVNQGDIYKIYINDWGKHKRDVLRAFYLGKYLGNINDSKIDKKIIEYQYRLPYSYDILHEKFSFKKPSFKPSSKRIDLSRQITFTIDPDASKDFDDAIFIDYHKKKGIYILDVHIADVSFFVKKNSPLDKEAYYRGNSTYLINNVIPMLPFELSNNLCSLVPNKKRFAVTMRCLINKKGQILYFNFFRSLIKSNMRYTYDDVSKILKSKQRKNRRNPKKIKQLHKKINLLGNLCDILQNKNKKTYELDEILKPKSIFVLDKNEKIIKFLKDKHDKSHQIIQEVMILTNHLVTKKIQDGLQKPLIFRVHNEPKKKKIDIFLEHVKYFKLIHQNDIKYFNRPNVLNDLYNQIMILLKKNKNIQTYFDYSFKKMMNPASYTTHNAGHYGLNLRDYTHFTSPIRRYNDLIIHRILLGEDYNTKELNKISHNITNTLRISKRSENAYKDMKIRRWLTDHTNKIFKGIILGMTSRHIIIRLKKFMFTIRLQAHFKTYKTFPKEYYFVDVKQRKTYNIADNINLKCTHVDIFMPDKTKWIIHS